MTAADRALPWWKVAAWALPSVAIAMAHTPANSIIPAAYATQAGIDLKAMGLVIFAAKAVDALVDPLIGALSDRTRSPFGARKPWVAVGAALMAVAVAFLFAVPDGATPTYFAVTYIAISVAWSVIEIPYRAWGVELASDYVGRSRVSTWLAIAWSVGPFLFLGLPFLPAFGGGGRVDAEFLRTASWVIIAGLAVATPLVLTLLPQGVQQSVKGDSFLATWRSVRRNRPLLLFIAVLLIGGLGGGMLNTLIVLYMQTILGIGGKAALVLLTYQALHLVATPLAFVLVKRFEKHRVWAVSWMLSALILPLFTLVPPGPGALVPFLVLVAIRGFVAAADMVVPMALLGDVVDYDLLKTGTQRTGKYTAFVILVLKFNMAIAGAAGFLVLGFIGFDPKGSNPPELVTAFKVLFCFVPPALYTVACALLWFFPITRARHAVIRRRIDSRAARLAREEPA